MRLFDFLECFDLKTPVLILDENRMVIDENIVGEITQKTMNQQEVLKVYHEVEKIVLTTCCSEFVKDMVRKEGEYDESYTRNAQKAGHHGVGEEDLEKIVNNCMKTDSALLYNNYKKECPPLLDIPDYIVV